MVTLGNFPFGEPVREVRQEDREPKCLFVLGVYASAVHAKWVGPDNKGGIRAVGVASEPYIFWCGDGAEEIVARIPVPSSAGRLELAAKQYNGPSGLPLDKYFLTPLGLDRSKAWLSDLVPHSCMNPSQKKAIQESYEPLVGNALLPAVSWPSVPSSLADETRCKEILAEIVDSGAHVVMLLGDEPIKWFLNHFDDRWTKVAHFGKTATEYGRLHSCQLQDLKIDVLPLVHPRQAAGLGHCDPEWRSLHDAWVKNCPVTLDC